MPGARGKLPRGFKVSDPYILSEDAWAFVWENFKERSPGAYYAEHKGAKYFILYLKAQGHDITLIEGV